MFITFEGSEGSGKTSQIGPLAESLRLAGLAVLTTREPGGTPIGEQVKSGRTHLVGDFTGVEYTWNEFVRGSKESRPSSVPAHKTPDRSIYKLETASLLRLEGSFLSCR